MGGQACTPGMCIIWRHNTNFIDIEISDDYYPGMPSIFRLVVLGLTRNCEFLALIHTADLVGELVGCHNFPEAVDSNQ
jgi:hypothetical protein